MKKLVVIVSSTARDLPEHREEAMNACLRSDTFPKMMEHLPAVAADAIAESLRLVDDADIYLGVFAHRYGFIPAGHDKSITELEYERATERGIPRLIFVIDKEHAIRIDDIESGASRRKLERFKKRLLAAHVVNLFKSPTHLHAQVVSSLSRLRNEWIEAEYEASRANLEENAESAYMEFAAQIEIHKAQFESALTIQERRFDALANVAEAKADRRLAEERLKASTVLLELISEVSVEIRMARLSALQAIRGHFNTLTKQIDVAGDVKECVLEWINLAFRDIANSLAEDGGKISRRLNGRLQEEGEDN